MAFNTPSTIYFQDFSFIPSFGCTVYFSRGACTLILLSLPNSGISKTITSPIAIKVLLSPWERKGTQYATALNTGWPYAKERGEWIKFQSFFTLDDNNAKDFFFCRILFRNNIQLFLGTQNRLIQNFKTKLFKHSQQEP